jgi:high-affinity K+ transport system ATPase subunit B
MDEIIQDRKARLIEQFNNLSEVTTETIMAAKSFSALVDKDLEGKVLKVIEKRFNEVYSEADQQAKSRSYSEMGENLKYLSNLAGFNAQLLQKAAINNLANRLRDLKTTLSNEAEACLTSIAEGITKNEARLNENAVREANQKIECVKEIEALKFLDNNADIRNRLTG